jgi:hypothetical protein
MTIQYVIQLKSYFEIFTILIFTYSEIYLVYFLSVVDNNYSVEVSNFLVLFCYM